MFLITLNDLSNTSDSDNEIEHRDNEYPTRSVGKAGFVDPKLDFSS